MFIRNWNYTKITGFKTETINIFGTDLYLQN